MYTFLNIEKIMKLRQQIYLLQPQRSRTETENFVNLIMTSTVISNQNRLSKTILMAGHIIGFGWEMRKLAFWKLSILDLICCSKSIVENETCALE